MRLGAMGLGSALVVGATVVVAVATPTVTSGCTTHQCDSELVNIDQSTGTTVGDVQTGQQGTFWESGSFYGTWLDYPGERTYFFSFPPGFTPVGAPSAWVATAPDATSADGGATYVEAGGQLAEFGAFVNGGFLVTNATCAYYYLYVSVPGTYVPPGTGD